MSIFGDIFGGSSTTNQSGTSATQTNPWAPAQPYLTQDLSNLSNLYGNGQQFSPLEQSGYADLAAQANPNGAAQSDLNAALAENQKTASGAYLDPTTNPYIAAIARDTAGTTMSNINSTFGGAGRSGSGLDAYYSGQGVANAENTLYDNNYNTERQLQQSAVNEAPSLATGSLAPSEALITAGQAVSARPYDLANSYASTLANIARLGGTSNTQTTGTSTTNTTPSLFSLFTQGADAYRNITGGF
jgi:hypothetical protein